MIDGLPNLWLLEQAGYDLGSVDHFLVPGPAGWIASSLIAAGVAADRTVRVDEGASLHIDRLLVPVRSVGSRRVPWWTVRGLTLDGRVVVRPDDGSPRIVYLRRGSAGRRGVRDEDVLAEELTAHGVTAVDPGLLGLETQRRLFASADIIIGAHGAALVSVAWCRPGAALIELMPTARPNALFLNLSRQAGVDHHLLACPPAADASGAHGDLRVDGRELLRVLRSIGRGLPTLT